MIEDLDLPIIKEGPPEPRWISMDRYFRFVLFNLRYLVNIKAIRKQKREMAVDVPFHL